MIVCSNQKAYPENTVFYLVYQLAVILFCKSYNTLAANAVILLAGKGIAVFIKGGLLCARVFDLQQEPPHASAGQTEIWLCSVDKPPTSLNLIF